MRGGARDGHNRSVDMAFLPGFAFDIFVSYSHVDNLGDLWVNKFHDRLEIALAKQHGRAGVITLWRDKRLHGNQLFDNTIKAAVEGSALFLAITSNGYLASDYCLQELRWFHAKAEAEPQGGRVGDTSRICNVLLAPLPPERWPVEYGRSSGFPFHDADDPNDPSGALGQPTDPEEDRLRFKRQMNALTVALIQTLQAFHAALEQATAAHAPAPAPAASASTSAGPRVFVADVSDALAGHRRRLVSELRTKGLAVASNVPPPYEAEAHDARVRELTQEALLSVHLLDQTPGREVDGVDGQTYPLRQLELARGRASSQLIWVPSDLDTPTVEDEAYRGILENLENGEREGSGHDFVRGARPLLVSQIVDKVAQLRKRAEAQAGPRGSVLLDTHLKDQLYALELSRLLVGRSIQPYINPQEDDPNKNLEAFESRLRQVSSLVILFGQVSEAWVRRRLGLALQMSVINDLQVKSFFVLIVPPAKASDAERFARGPVQVQLIDNSGSPDLAARSVDTLCGADGVPA
ncbi:TIR domain-containing protein [Variovorax rhizosphaerae]|uniref:TIR domain-containing protein n=1 Tax=Variovorax rhizosphaerae TaxID=1836200 RepID=A0ABU8WM00_9BURK